MDADTAISIDTQMQFQTEETEICITERTGYMDSVDKNISYFFVPFCYEDSFNNMLKQIAGSGKWNMVHDEIQYMLKYVADKIDSNNVRECQCFHYELKESERQSLGIVSEEKWCQQGLHKFQGETCRFSFQLRKIQMYCFATGVGILAFQVHFESDDPMWMATAQYHLKKVSRETVSVSDGEPFVKSDSEINTIQKLAEFLISGFAVPRSCKVFFYANPSTERANVLTFLEIPAGKDYRKELYHLRRCQGEGYFYVENTKLEEREIYSTTNGITWGISSEAAVCLACPENGQESFIHGKFYKNFNSQYLFMYVLLLHQKYVLYRFLTRIGIGEHNDLELLEQYRQELYEFETNFVFSCITEVVQYQELYNRMAEAFALQKMYEDVREPLISLSEIRRSNAENMQKERDDRVNRALLFLSLLSFFSALVDSFDFIESAFRAFFGSNIGENVIRITQGVCIILIIAVLIYAVLELRKSAKEK